MNGTNHVSTVFILYYYDTFFLPFSNLAKHKNLSFSIGFAIIFNHFCTHSLPNVQKSPTDHFCYLYCNTIFDNFHGVGRADKGREGS